jgi:hypothetical protein
MQDIMYLGITPADEYCAQINDPDYRNKAFAEGRRWIERLRELFGPEPEGARLTIKGEGHDFGTYYEVCCRYDPEQDAARAYAWRCEADAPSTWEGPALERYEAGDLS